LTLEVNKMAEIQNEGRETPGGAANDASDRDFASVLGSILESAARMVPAAEELDLRFSVALVGEMGIDELADLVKDLPVVAHIALSEELGGKAAILIDIPTASALASLISTGIPSAKEPLSEEDIASLQEALNPIVDALSTTCEDATGRPFGSIEKIEVSDPAGKEFVVEGFPESLCRAMASVSITKEISGQLALALPLNLAEAMAETKSISPAPAVHAYEPVELEEEDASAYPEVQTAREPLTENIGLILDIQLRLSARLGQVEMPIGEILKLSPGSVIDIDQLVDEPIELVVNDRPIARGEIVVVQENFGIRITEIISPKERIKSLR
jgi:flagellar motor switch protein FliN/FliY